LANFITIKGGKELEKRIRDLDKEIQAEVGEETFQSAKTWEQRAKMDAPVDQGLLRSQIRGSKTGKLESEVASPAEHSAYLEFGTKSKVRIPAGLAGYAAQFRGGGPAKGDAKKFIYAWMDRVGIPKENQWSVFISIIVNGIKPQPFFFVHQPFVNKEFIKNVNNILKKPH
jgi:hypothetical protein